MNHIQELGISDLITVPGFIDGEDLRALYEICTAVISPSLAEGGAYIAQEAISYGKPVACSNIRAVRRHLERMGAQIPLFDPFDVEAIVKAIIEITDNASTIVSQNVQARSRITTWTWDSVAKRYVAVLDWVARGCLRGTRPAQQDL